MGMLDNLRNRLVDWLTSGNERAAARADWVLDRREYRLGMQKRFIRVKPNQPDDNLIMNFTGLAVDRAVSMLMGKGFTLEWEEGSEAQEEYIDQVMKDNTWDTLMHRTAISGAEAGMVFVKIVPREGMTPQLVLMDSALMDIETDPHDYSKIVKYTIQYKFTNAEGKEVAYRQITEWVQRGDEDPISPDDSQSGNGHWLITDWETNRAGQWELTKSISWGYDFAPIVSWQNLPNISEVWGMPDITADVMELQDRTNFVASNLSKIIRLYAHPQRYGVNIGKPEKLDMGVDTIISLSNPDSRIEQLQPAADMASSFQYLLGMRQSLFDITRTVDITSIADKIGALTNFGLHVLYQDALSKTETKRQLYGWGIQEIIRRVLILAGLEPVEVEIDWNDPLPENELEEMQAAKMALDMGVVDKQTIAGRLGFDWETVQERKAEEGQSELNIGEALLRGFDRGQEQGAPAER